MPREDKVRLVEELKDKLRRSTIFIGTNFQGLSVQQMNELRRRLRAQGLEYRVVKNTLTYIAAREVGKTAIEEVVQGPTGILFGYGDPVEPARVLEEYLRSTRSPLSIRGAVMDASFLTAEEVRRLATLPPRSQLLAQLLGQLQAPVVRLLYVLQAPLQGLATVLQRHLELLGPGPGTTAPPAAPAVTASEPSPPQAEPPEEAPPEEEATAPQETPSEEAEEAEGAKEGS